MDFSSAMMGTLSLVMAAALAATLKQATSALAEAQPQRTLARKYVEMAGTWAHMHVMTAI